MPTQNMPRLSVWLGGDTTLDATTGEEAHDALESHLPAPLEVEEDREPVSEANSIHSKLKTQHSKPMIQNDCWQPIHWLSKLGNQASFHKGW
jgi:hypothetical protein